MHRQRGRGRQAHYSYIHRRPRAPAASGQRTAGGAAPPPHPVRGRFASDDARRTCRSVEMYQELRVSSRLTWLPGRRTRRPDCRVTGSNRNYSVIGRRSPMRHTRALEVLLVLVALLLGAPALWAESFAPVGNLDCNGLQRDPEAAQAHPGLCGLPRPGIRRTRL